MSANLSSGAAWINDAIVPIAEARIPVNDWGVTHSDATYDVAVVWDGAFFRLSDHIERFEQSCAGLRLKTGIDRTRLREILHGLVVATGLRQAYVAMVTTRGLPLIPGSRDPRECANRFFAWCVPYIRIIKPEVAAKGATVHIPTDIRRIPEDSVNARIKNYHWGDFTAGLFEAKDLGFETVILLDHDDYVTEGPGFNVFAVKGDRLLTPTRHCLHGITRRTVIEIGRELGYEVIEADLPLADLLEADELFISTSGGGPVWIAQVRDRTFSNGAEGPVTAAVRELYWQWINSRTDLRDPVDYTAKRPVA